MKTIVFFCGLSFLISGFVSERSVRSVYTTYIDDNSRLYIEGSSNVNTFECNSKDKCAPISVGISINESADTVRLSNALLQLHTMNLDCSNSKMNSDLQDALKAEQYPVIKIDLLGVMLNDGSRFDDIENEWKTVKALATFTITNVTKRVVMDVRVRRLDFGKYRFMAQKQVRMTDYNVQPPEVLFGMVKVNNVISINMDVTARLVKE
ncbi:MAG: YceI family protein [Ignavibacteriae bacterium]|nr:YceI family protein [Ignavibacteriota bacterium]